MTSPLSSPPRRWVYPFPGNASVLMKVLTGIAQIGPDPIDWDWAPCVGLRLSSATSAVYLRMAFEEERMTDIDDEPSMGSDEITVPRHRRAECEAVIRDACAGDGQWFEMIEFTFPDDAAHRAFATIYTQHTGLPAAY